MLLYSSSKCRGSRSIGPTVSGNFQILSKNCDKLVNMAASDDKYSCPLRFGNVVNWFYSEWHWFWVPKLEILLYSSSKCRGSWTIRSTVTWIFQILSKNYGTLANILAPRGLEMLTISQVLNTILKFHTWVCKNWSIKAVYDLFFFCNILTSIQCSNWPKGAAFQFLTSSLHSSATILKFRW